MGIYLTLEAWVVLDHVLYKQIKYSFIYRRLNDDDIFFCYITLMIPKLFLKYHFLDR